MAKLRQDRNLVITKIRQRFGGDPRLPAQLLLGEGDGSRLPGGRGGVRVPDARRHRRIAFGDGPVVQQPQPGNQSALEADKGDKLRQRHDAFLAPSRLGQRP